MSKLDKRIDIQALITDVDGVLTDGGIYYDNNGNEFKKFNVKDGQIVKYLKQNSIILGVITGRVSKVMDRRVEELGFDFYRKGVSDKAKVLNEFLNIYGIDAKNVAYIGDDIIDVPVFKRVGFSGTPQDSKDYIKELVDCVTPSRGGEGAFRDFAETILNSMGVFDDIIDSL